jgi:sec-independent protein translocase protein TatC
MAKEREMTILEHLEELRERLIKSAIALFIATLFSFFFARRLLEFLIAPMGSHKPIALRPTEAVVIYFKLAFILGAVLAMPFIVYQLFRFVTPGLKPKEKQYLYIFAPIASLSFASGVAFASLIILPFSIKYLQGFLSDIIKPVYSIGHYISFVTSLLLWVGLSFETPLLIFFLAKLGVVNPKMLRRGRRYVYLLFAFIAAVITPTVDPFNMMLVMVPLLVLYEVGVILAKLAYRKHT